MHDSNVAPTLSPVVRGFPPSGCGGEAGGEADGGAAGGVAAGLRPLLPHAALLEDGPRDAGQLETPPARGGAVEPGGLRPDLQVGLVVVMGMMMVVVVMMVVLVIVMVMMRTDCQHHYLCC